LDDPRLAPRLRRILCSATLTRNPQKLAALALDRPLLIAESEAVSNLPSTLTEQVFWVSRNSKPLVLLYLLRQRPGRVLVFCSSVERAERVCDLLKKTEHTCDLLSANQTVKQRAKVLNLFKNSEIKVLVASDVVARGIDIESLECVLSYDCPHKAKTYVHRAGRTARASKSGLSVVLCRKDQARHFRQIKTKLSAPPPVFTKIPREEVVEFRSLVEAFTKGESESEGGDDSE